MSQSKNYIEHSEINCHGVQIADTSGGGRGDSPSDRIWVGVGVEGQWLASLQVRELAAALVSTANSHDARVADNAPMPDSRAAIGVVEIREKVRDVLALVDSLAHSLNDIFTTADSAECAGEGRTKEAQSLSRLHAVKTLDHFGLMTGTPAKNSVVVDLKRWVDAAPTQQQ